RVYLDTLAAAYAEAGDFDRAEAAEPMGLASGKNQKIYFRRYLGYRAQKPYREGEASGLASRELVDALARNGLWQDAIHAIGLEPTPERYDLGLGPLLVQIGDLNGYRKHCQR